MTIKAQFDHANCEDCPIRHRAVCARCDTDELEEQLSIYPNPAEKEIFVHTRDFVGQKASLQIQNLLGQTMTERSFDAMPDEPIAFQLNGFEAGVYALKIQVEGRKVVTKLFVVADL